MNTRTLAGLLIVLLGVALMFEQFGLGSIWVFFWPSLFVIIGILTVVRGNLQIGVFFILLALLMLVSELFSVSFWAIIWPALIILVGINLLLGDHIKMGFNSSSSNDDRADFEDRALFWGVEKRYTSQKFRSGKLSAIFGGLEADLSDLKLDKNGAKLEVTVLFGGVELKVPENISVIVKGEGIIGGWDNKLSNSSEGSPQLTIDGVAIFGGVTLKN